MKWLHTLRNCFASTETKHDIQLRQLIPSAQMTSNSSFLALLNDERNPVQHVP